jgi:hypothetical protein
MRVRWRSRARASHSLWGETHGRSQNSSTLSMVARSSRVGGHSRSQPAYGSRVLRTRARHERSSTPRPDPIAERQPRHSLSPSTPCNPRLSRPLPFCCMATTTRPIRSLYPKISRREFQTPNSSRFLKAATCFRSRTRSRLAEHRSLPRFVAPNSAARHALQGPAAAESPARPS